MGVVDFDPENWSRANACEPDELVAKVANPANPSRFSSENSQHSQDSQVAPLPSDVRDGVAILRQMKAPRGVRADRWPGVVADAVYLIESGWAERALAKDWKPLHLFGALIARDGDPYSDGLAVWLAGRKIAALLDGCVAAEVSGGRAYFNRREQVGAKLLWELI